MAGSNGLWNKILKTIGIVDEPEGEYNDDAYPGEYAARSGQPPRSPRTAQFDPYAQQPGARYSPGGTQPRYDTGRSAGPARQSAGSYPPRGAAPQAPLRSAAGYDDPFAEPARGRTSRFEPQSEPRRAEPRPEGRPRTVIYAIRTMEECQDVIVDLINGKTTVVNVEGLHTELQQRVIDTLSGASFALEAAVRKASDTIYLIAPKGVEVNDTGSIERRY